MTFTLTIPNLASSYRYSRWMDWCNRWIASVWPMDEGFTIPYNSLLDTKNVYP